MLLAKLLRPLILSFLYPLAVKSSYLVASLFPVESKWKKWSSTRGLRIQSNNKSKKTKYIFIYCDSLGEWENVNGIVSRIRANYPAYFIELCFFSSSGFEAVRSETLKYDSISYMPLDRFKMIDFFFQSAQPDLILISHHSIWPKFLDYAISKNIPYSFISAQFHQNSLLKRFYFEVLKEYILQAAGIYSGATEKSVKTGPDSYRKFNYYGNPRIGANLKRVETIDKKLSNAKPLILFGSIHKEDLHLMKVLYNTDNSTTKWVIPHELADEIVERIQSEFPQISIWTSESCTDDMKWYLINRFGILKKLYSHATLAYVGGGFGNGIHNIFEALVYQIPVLIGPKYKRFPETEHLITMGAVHVATNPQKFLSLVEELQYQGLSASIKEQLKTYLETHRTSEDRIYLDLQTHFFT